jgi:hypothetical protein
MSDRELMELLAEIEQRRAELRNALRTVEIATMFMLFTFLLAAASVWSIWCIR